MHLPTNLVCQYPLWSTTRVFGLTNCHPGVILCVGGLTFVFFQNRVFWVHLDKSWNYAFGESS